MTVGTYADAVAYGHRAYYARLGLRESLEEYAARHRATPADARVAWRVLGLLALGVDLESAARAALRGGLCLIGGPVRVGPRPDLVLSDDEAAP